ncbi:hypothetical protein F5H01DRAFT_342284 [Linnemannia elongata]|nr:hypothetical protein F5H01DRAFT_342284 [Linnemannia elongata]
MNLFDITELVEQVGSHLNQHDLSNCVRVNKSWNTAFIPLLWRTVPPPRYRTSEGWNLDHQPHRISFRQLVLEDYLSSQQEQRREGEHNCPARTAFSRNGRWIRDLGLSQSDLSPQPVPSSSGPQPSIHSSVAAAAAIATALPEPTDLELTRHMLQQCTSLQRLRLSGMNEGAPHFESWRSIVRSSLPDTLTDLAIKLDSEAKLSASSIPPLLFSQCHPGLRKLSLHVSHVGHEVEEAEEESGEDEPLLLMNEVRVTCESFSERVHAYPPSWPRFLRRCTNLETLVVTSIDQTWIQALEACVHLRKLEIQAPCEDSLQVLTTALKTGLPNLDSIYINDQYFVTTDEDKAAMLSTGLQGWRSITLQDAGPFTIEAVMKHCSTLENLSLRMALGLTSAHVVKILSSSPNLQSLITLAEDDYTNFKFRNNETTYISAKDFIDADPSSEFLKPWACESSLRILRAKIGGIPRPDITRTCTDRPLRDGMVIQGSYPAQSREIQGRILDRLARMTRLERLELGNEDRALDSEERRRMPTTFLTAMDGLEFQYDCLEMSLGSGLWKLEGLKELRVLGVVRMATRIGEEEERWMKECWPKLELMYRTGNPWSRRNYEVVDMK